MSSELPNFNGFYERWVKLPSGPKAELRRVATPDELLDLPAFYRLAEPFGWASGLKPWERQRWLNLVFLINHITHSGENSLGKALALSKVSEKRLYQVVRAETPKDIIQLRRLLKQAEPNLSWPKMATQIWYWNIRQKRNLLEDFILNQKD